MARATLLDCELTASHWGAWQVRRERGVPVGLDPWRGDPDPNPLGPAMWEAYRSPLRILRPAVRAGFLQRRPDDAARGAGRGREPFVEVSWEQALDLVADELRRVIALHGNEAVLGGSYGWGSAGRFHHTQSQIHRFLNTLGGYVGQVGNYSLGAAIALLPHVLCPMDDLMAHAHDWDTLVAHTRLFVAFGGVPGKNTRVGPGGASEHGVRPGLARLAAAGCRFVNFSPLRAGLELEGCAVEWIPIRPGSDTAVLLALACELVRSGRHDRAFLASHCTGFEAWADYLLGRSDGIVKDADWAAPLAGVPAARLRALAGELVATRSLVNVAWSLQRADHGEQPFWAAIGLACVVGQVGLPGGGCALGYGPANTMGSPHRLLPGPVLPQGRNAVSAFIPVARLTDLLLHPGETFDFDGQVRRYPRIRLIHWAGGNPWHHHQDLHRLARAWRRPETIVVHEQFWNAHARMADIVLPATCTLERDDLGSGRRDPLLIAMKRVLAAPGQARNEYDALAALAGRMGVRDAYTEGRDAMAWMRLMYGQTVAAWAEQGVELPDFDTFWQAGGVRLPDNDRPVVSFAGFRADPRGQPLATPSGRIELHSAWLAGLGKADCPGHPSWLEPAEWLGAPLARRYPLHLLSDQPHARLHSQLDHSPLSRANKVAGREPIHLHPDDAAARGIAAGDVVRVFNDRGACLAGARLDAGLMPGVVKLSTGAWWDPESPGDPAGLDRHGNPNTLTRDVGASSLSQACAAQTCLVQVERHAGAAPPVRVFDPPVMVGADAAASPSSRLVPTI